MPTAAAVTPDAAAPPRRRRVTANDAHANGSATDPPPAPEPAPTAGTAAATCGAPVIARAALGLTAGWPASHCTPRGARAAAAGGTTTESDTVDAEVRADLTPGRAARGVPAAAAGAFAPAERLVAPPRAFGFAEPAASAALLGADEASSGPSAAATPTCGPARYSPIANAAVPNRADLLFFDRFDDFRPDI